MIFDFANFVNRKSRFSSNDACRMAAYFVQDGKCYVTQTPLQIGQRELHHRCPRSYGGKDEPENLVLLTKTVHRMVHAPSESEFADLLSQAPLTDKQLAMVNQLRYEAHRVPYTR